MTQTEASRVTSQDLASTMRGFTRIDMDVIIDDMLRSCGMLASIDRTLHDRRPPWVDPSAPARRRWERHCRATKRRRLLRSAGTVRALTDLVLNTNARIRIFTDKRAAGGPLAAWERQLAALRYLELPTRRIQGRGAAGGGSRRRQRRRRLAAMVARLRSAAGDKTDGREWSGDGGYTASPPVGGRCGAGSQQPTRDTTMGLTEAAPASGRGTDAGASPPAQPRPPAAGAAGEGPTLGQRHGPGPAAGATQDLAGDGHEDRTQRQRREKTDETTGSLM